MGKPGKRRPTKRFRTAMKRFGPRLRVLRQDRRLSQRELAELVGIDVMQVNRYERGVHLPSVETSIKLARLFGMTTDELLLGGDGNLDVPEIRNVKLYDRFRILDALPKKDQEMVVQLVDAVIAKRRMSTLLQETGS